MVERIPVEGECFTVFAGSVNKWICLEDATSHYSFKVSKTIGADISASPLTILIPKEYT